MSYFDEVEEIFPGKEKMFLSLKMTESQVKRKNQNR